MIPGYVVPRLIGNIKFSMQPTAKSDVYSFAILIYKVFFCKEASSIYATAKCCAKWI